MLKKIHLLFLVSILFNLEARANFDFNDNCQKAYQEILHLKLNGARQRIANEKKINPSNDLVWLLENYIDYFYLLASDRKTDFDQLKKNKGIRLSKLNAADQSSPYYLYAQAEINLQWALLRGRYQEYLSSALEIRKANGLLKQSMKEFPDFLPAKKSLGMLNAVLGSLPSGAQKALGTLGVRGDTESGKRMLQAVVEAIPNSPYSFFYDESVFYLTQVLINITKDKNAFEQVIQKTKNIPNSSLLKTYLNAYAALKTGHNEQTIKFINDRPRGEAYVDYPYLTYMLATAKLNRLDPDAGQTFKTFIAMNQGASLIKDAYLMLAYAELLNNNQSAYETNMSKVKTEGTTYDEKDKQALNEEAESKPKKELLQARFLFDGGYYSRAKEILLKHNANQYTLPRDKIEYCYRLGRVYDAIDAHDNALKMYGYAINFGRNEKYYYAANAALLSGNIYEQQQRYDKADSLYNEAIGMKNHDYESSIENKAKDGLSRIKGK